MVFGRKKKVNDSTGSLSSYVEPPASRPSLPLSQTSDVSSVSEEKEHNPGGEPYPSPPPERYTSRFRTSRTDDHHRSPQQPAQVNVYVQTAHSPPTVTGAAPKSTYRPSTAGQQPIPRHCGVTCIRKITRTSNRNGNAGRPYYVCADCNKFVTWDDDVGLEGDNPKCDCGEISRRGITNADKGRKFFFKCVTGKCDFFEWKYNDDGTQFSVSEDVAEALRKLRVA